MHCSRTARQDKVIIRGIVQGKGVTISPITNVVASRCLEERFVFDKEWEKEITWEIVDIMLYGGPQPVTNDKVVLRRFLRPTNLSHMCRLIHIFYMCKVLVGEKMKKNLVPYGMMFTHIMRC